MIILKWGLGIGDWGLGIGDWAQSPIPNPHIYFCECLLIKLFKLPINLLLKIYIYKFKIIYISKKESYIKYYILLSFCISSSFIFIFVLLAKYKYFNILNIIFFSS